MLDVPDTVKELWNPSRYGDGPSHRNQEVSPRVSRFTKFGGFRRQGPLPGARSVLPPPGGSGSEPSTRADLWVIHPLYSLQSVNRAFTRTRKMEAP